MKTTLFAALMLVSAGTVHAQAVTDKNLSITCLVNGANHANAARYIGNVKNGDVVSFVISNAQTKEQYAVDSFTVRYVLKVANTTKQQIQEYSKPRTVRFAKGSKMQVNVADLNLPDSVKVMISLGRVYEVGGDSKNYVAVHHGKKEFTFDYHR